MEISQRARARVDRGSALVEAAFAVPVFLFLIFGLIELSGALRASSTLENAARSAGRAASVAGADPMSDRMMLSRFEREAGTVPAEAIDLIVIWHAAGPGDPVPAGCLTHSTLAPNPTSVGVSDQGTDAVGACNVYIRPGDPGGVFAALDAANPDAKFGCQGALDPLASTKLDCSWPGKDRRAVTRPRDSLLAPRSTDFVGIYVRATHKYYSGLFGTSLTLTDRTVHLIEPQGYDFT